MKRALLLLGLVACGKSAAKPAGEITYEDWDSYDDARVFVKDVERTVSGDQTRLEADGYLPSVVTREPGVRYPIAARGMLLSRINRFYEGLRAGAWDPSTALVEIEVRKQPGGAAVDGVTVSVNAAKAFRRNWNGGWSPTNVTGEGGAYFAFPNVLVGGGWATLDVHAAGLRCHGPKTIPLAAGEVSIAQVACEKPAASR